MSQYNYSVPIPKGFDPDCDRISLNPITSLLNALLLASFCSVRDTYRDNQTRQWECGRSHKGYKLIYGGTNVRLGEFPWMALVGWQYYTAVNVEYTLYPCGGSLITDQHVLTAAHCLVEQKVSLMPDNVAMFKVILGVTSRRPRSMEKKYQQIYIVKKHMVHQAYNHATMQNDIALLKLDRKVLFNDYIRPICLPAQVNLTNSHTGKDTVVAGWGLNESETVTTDLLKVNKKIVDLRQCKEIHGGKTSFVVGESNICAGGVKDEDACFGDSGGPLMLRTKHVWTVVGVLSWGNVECGVGGYPAVYTRVTSFMGWILNRLDR